MIERIAPFSAWRHPVMNGNLFYFSFITDRMVSLVKQFLSAFHDLKSLQCGLETCDITCIPEDMGDFLFCFCGHAHWCFILPDCSRPTPFASVIWQLVSTCQPSSSAAEFLLMPWCPFETSNLSLIQCHSLNAEPHDQLLEVLCPRLWQRCYLTL